MSIQTAESRITLAHEALARLTRHFQLPAEMADELATVTKHMDAARRALGALSEPRRRRVDDMRVSSRRSIDAAVKAR